MVTMRRKFLSITGIAAIATAAAAFTAGPASACAVLRVRTSAPPDLLARAFHDLEMGNTRRAMSDARKVASGRRVSPTRRAEALTIMAWISWDTNRPAAHALF